MSLGTPRALSSDPIERALLRASSILPDQGPIGVFIHHNTLHAFQHLPFHEGVQAGASALSAEPYLTLAAFRSAWRSGRITDADLTAEIVRALGSGANSPVLGGLTRAQLWHELMVHDCDPEDAAGFRFALAAETARPMRDRPLWAACEQRIVRGPQLAIPDARVVRRHRDVLRSLGADEPDLAVHGELIRLGSGFLDQGQAHIVLPERERGFLRAVAAMYRKGATAPRACRGVEEVMAGLDGADAKQVISSTLDAMGVRGAEIEPFLLATALALPGWAGMFSRLERNPSEDPSGLPITLADFLAVRLVLDRFNVASLCATLDVPSDWSALRALLPPLPARDRVCDASVLWTLFHAAGLDAAAVQRCDDAALQRVWNEVAACTTRERRRVFQEAYERSYRVQILDAVAARRALPSLATSERPRVQFVFCIDEREESIRRALEEQHAGYETFGMAGFFGVAIDFQGLYDREPVPYCPVVVTPAHEVYEQPVYTDLARHLVSREWRDRWHGIERRALAASRTLVGGAGMSFLLGPLSAVRTLARVMVPRRAQQWDDQLSSRLAPRPTTRLTAMRVSQAASALPGAAADDGGKPVGFSLDESIERVTAVLTNLGMVRDFAPVIVFLGHGSTSLNNPHESAHDCGACGGRRGGGNARLFADMANRTDVREGVRQRGISIPADTWFVGALHDTADDSVRYYDLEALPAASVARFDEAYAALERARRENALERSRRFDNAPLTLSPAQALHHVEDRAAHLAQPRPEYGHCTNSICIVGRRALTRGLHLDRRAFLVSYDPTIDRDDKVLERILAAVGPVGAGISLEYYFSSVDNETFGCGTKLPHNVTGLIGVMNGHQSDLRTGLPLQMVEIHEPMRLLIIVDATPDALLTVASRQPEVAELVTKAWVQLVSAHPETGAMAVFRDGGFEPFDPSPVLLPVVERSPEWHLQSRAHLPPALVRRALPESAVGSGHRGTPASLAAEVL